MVKFEFLNILGEENETQRSVLSFENSTWAVNKTNDKRIENIKKAAKPYLKKKYKSNRQLHPLRIDMSKVLKSNKITHLTSKNSFLLIAFSRGGRPH